MENLRTTQSYLRFLFKDMLPFIKLTDGVVTLRPFEFGEEGRLQTAIQESLPELEPWMSWASENYTVEAAKNFITITRAHWASGEMYGFAITDATSGEFLGGCGLNHLHLVYHFCNLGYWVRTSHHGKGIAGRAAKLAAKFAFEKVHLIRAEIVIAVGNERSRRTAEKIGAHYEGVLLNRMVVGRTMYDAHMFSLIPSDFGLTAQL
jgi:ribosomal-protein-serine acetyltransferase